MIIQVLGSGCPSCKKLFELTKEAVKDIGLEIEVEYITDIQKLTDVGVMSSPILTINGKVVLARMIPNKEKIKDLIANFKPANSQPSSGCSCGKGCC